MDPESLQKILTTLEEIVGGNTSLRLPLSDRRDGLDAISFAINSLVQELTYLKEKAEAASQAKSRFLAVISHEIRTPVTVIKGFSEHLANPHLSEGDREKANNRVSSNCKVLLELIDEILDLSKVEEGKLRILKQKFSLLNFLNGMISDTTAAAQEKGLKLQLFISSIGLDEIETDQVRLRQILNNIIGNAIKFTDNGSVEVKISTEELQNRMVLKVEVSDTGIGISRDQRKLLFQPFSQLNQSFNRTHGGTGLGLVLSKRLAQLLGGDLDLLKSELGKGTTFIIRIDGGPIVASDSKASRDETVKEKFALDVNSLKNVNILLAEDNLDLQDLLKMLLESAGAKVTVASTGKEAVEIAIAKEFDIVLMDIRMPIMGGIEATQTLRQKGFRTPILAITAQAMAEHLNECIEAGCNDFVTKPIDEEKLFSKILQYT